METTDTDRREGGGERGGVRGGERGGGGGDATQRTDAHSFDRSSPPDYPCREECGRCKEKKIEPPSAEPPLPVCSCECHCAKNLKDPTRYPPTGTNCLPGCGYSGLPCYNCSLLQAHLQPQQLNPATGPSSASMPAFCPRIYTIELMERPSREADQVPRQQAGAEGDAQGKNVGVSLVFFTVFLIVFITIFKILFAGVRGSLW